MIRHRRPPKVSLFLRQHKKMKHIWALPLSMCWFSPPAYTDRRLALFALPVRRSINRKPDDRVFGLGEADSAEKLRVDQE